MSCQAITKKGTPCKHNAACPVHQHRQKGGDLAPYNYEEELRYRMKDPWYASKKRADELAARKAKITAIANARGSSAFSVSNILKAMGNEAVHGIKAIGQNPVTYVKDVIKRAGHTPEEGFTKLVGGRARAKKK